MFEQLIELKLAQLGFLNILLSLASMIVMLLTTGLKLGAETSTVKDSGTQALMIYFPRCICRGGRKREARGPLQSANGV